MSVWPSSPIGSSVRCLRNLMTFSIERSESLTSSNIPPFQTRKVFEKNLLHSVNHLLISHWIQIDVGKNICSHKFLRCDSSSKLHLSIYVFFIYMISVKNFKVRKHYCDIIISNSSVCPFRLCKTFPILVTHGQISKC